VKGKRALQSFPLKLTRSRLPVSDLSNNLEQSSLQSLPLYLILNDKLLATVAVSRQEVKSKREEPGEIALKLKAFCSIHAAVTHSRFRVSWDFNFVISICTYYIQPSFNVRYHARYTAIWWDGSVYVSSPAWDLPIPRVCACSAVLSSGFHPSSMEPGHILPILKELIFSIQARSQAHAPMLGSKHWQGSACFTGVSDLVSFGNRARRRDITTFLASILGAPLLSTS
jgi:hypothetical protein